MKRLILISFAAAATIAAQQSGAVPGGNAATQGPFHQDRLLSMPRLRRSGRQGRSAASADPTEGAGSDSLRPSSAGRNACLYGKGGVGSGTEGHLRLHQVATPPPKAVKDTPLLNRIKGGDSIRTGRGRETHRHCWSLWWATGTGVESEPDLVGRPGCQTIRLLSAALLLVPGAGPRGSERLDESRPSLAGC